MEVQGVTLNETFVQQNSIITLQNDRQTLKEKLTRPTQSFILTGSINEYGKLHHLALKLFIQSWRPMANYAVTAGTVIIIIIIIINS